MTRKQKTLALVGILGIFLFPSASSATETLSVTKKQKTNTDPTFLLEEEVTFTTAKNSENKELLDDIAPASPVERRVIPVNFTLLAAAEAQEGIAQDCTDLVQNALAAIGKTTRRDQGGFDYGTIDFVEFGYLVSASEAQPGDIAFRGPGNGGHVFIVKDSSGLGVHGGWNGSTVIANDGMSLSSYSIVRVQP